MERVLQKPKPMSCNNDWKIIQNLNSDVAKRFIDSIQEEQNKRQTEEWLKKIANENKNVIVLLKCGEEVAIACGVLSDIATTLGDSVVNITQKIQELSISFEIEVKPNMEEAIEKLREFHFNKIKDLKSDDVIIKQKYSQPPYRERLHPKDVVAFHRCRIRNRPNSGHGFKK